MSGIERIRSNEIVVPGIGEVVSRDDPGACARALVTLRELDDQVREVKRTLSEAIAESAAVMGTRTLRADGWTIKVGSDERTVYDAEAIERELLAAGMPRERVAQIVRVTIEKDVAAAEAKRAAGANPAYAEIIRRHARVERRPPWVGVRRDPEA